MNHSEFHIGLEFRMGVGVWRCTDVGTRVIVAIRVDQMTRVTSENRVERTDVLTRAEAEAEGWFNGPPYAVAEQVVDEYDMEDCEPLTSA